MFIGIMPASLKSSTPLSLQFATDYSDKLVAMLPDRLHYSVLDTRESLPAVNYNCW